jgi:hypothetical protein
VQPISRAPMNRGFARVACWLFCFFDKLRCPDRLAPISARCLGADIALFVERARFSGKNQLDRLSCGHEPGHRICERMQIRDIPTIGTVPDAGAQVVGGASMIELHFADGLLKFRKFMREPEEPSGSKKISQVCGHPPQAIGRT